MSIRVFKRRPWRRVNGRWEPLGGARKTTVQYVETVEQAREICARANAQNDRGKPGQIWHEFESEGGTSSLGVNGRG